MNSRGKLVTSDIRRLPNGVKLNNTEFLIIKRYDLNNQILLSDTSYYLFLPTMLFGMRLTDDFTENLKILSYLGSDGCHTNKISECGIPISAETINTGKILHLHKKLVEIESSFYFSLVNQDTDYKKSPIKNYVMFEIGANDLAIEIELMTGLFLMISNPITNGHEYTITLNEKKRIKTGIRYSNETLALLEIKTVNFECSVGVIFVLKTNRYM